MSGLLDTSMLIRYLTGEPPALAERAAEVIDGDSDLQVTDGVLMETAFVLTSVYGVSRAVVVNSLIAFLQKENIVTFRIEKGLVLQALLLCRPSGRVSFADALLWAATCSTDERVVYSLDERFPADGIELKDGIELRDGIDLKNEGNRR